jgi:hypothetical protein
MVKGLDGFWLEGGYKGFRVEVVEEVEDLKVLGWRRRRILRFMEGSWKWMVKGYLGIRRNEDWEKRRI